MPQARRHAEAAIQVSHDAAPAPIISAGTRMTEFFGSIWWLIVSLGVLVTFHEFGHYWVARRCGVKVLRFSVGFGKPLWTRRGQDGTEYVIAAIPLGGYVKMLDEREGDVAAGRTRRRPSTASRCGKRIAIVAAGPLANLCCAWRCCGRMFVIGRPDYAPVVGHVQGIAAQAGLAARRHRCSPIGERDTPTWSEAQLALIPAALDHADVAVQVRTAARRPSDTRQLQLSRPAAGVRRAPRGRRDRPDAAPPAGAGR